MKHGRDGLGHLDEDECWEFLTKHSLGRVAIVHMGNPMVFPVNYALEGRSVVFRTSPGTKLAGLTPGALAAFEVDEASPMFETGTSVVVHGRMREESDPEVRTRLATLPLRVWAPGDRDRYVRIVATWVSGRQIMTHPQDEGLGTDGG